MIILTDDHTEISVIKLKYNKNSNIEKLFSQLCNFKIIFSPEFENLYKAIYNPFKIIKHKNTSIITDSAVQLDDTIYKTVMQHPSDILKSKKRYNGCEDYIELSITNPLGKISFYAIKKNPEILNDKKFIYYITRHDCENLHLFNFFINNFIEQYSLLNTYISLYKNFDCSHIEDFNGLINNSKYKQTILDNDKFILNFVNSSKQPGKTLDCLIYSKLISLKWKNGKDFLSYFKTLFSVHNNIDFIENNYDKAILGHSLKSNFINLKQNKTTKI